jgi:hypothetical protein
MVRIFQILPPSAKKEKKKGKNLKEIHALLSRRLIEERAKSSKMAHPI